jgi:hypothetical protein
MTKDTIRQAVLRRNARVARERFTARMTVMSLGTIVLGMAAMMGSTCFAVPPQRSDVWMSGAWTNSAMKEMATKLQPTGTTGFTGKTKWDLSGEALKKKLAYLARRKELFRQLGIDKRHFSVHAYHRQPNFPDSAARVGITGERCRNAISPRRTEGKEWWTFCKSHVEFRDAMTENVKAAIDGGAGLIHFEDFFRNETQCLCDRCTERFCQALQGDPGLARFHASLRQMGIRDLPQFDIRRYLLERTEGDERNRQRQFSRMGALWRAWSVFKDHVAFDFLTRLCHAGRKYARESDRDVAFAQHFWYFRQQDLAISDAYDGVWPETPLLHYGAQPRQRTAGGYRLGIAVYPPNGAMGSAASVLRSAFRCPPIFIGYGGDWYHRLAFKRGPYERLVQVWTAEVYASGGTMQYLYRLPEKQLLGRELYRKLRAKLPTELFDRERSPAEYRCPLDAAGQYTRFVRAHPELYDGCEPPRQVLLLKTERGYNLGSGDENVYAWAQLLDDAHVPYRVMLDGGGQKRARLNGEQLRGYGRVIALGMPSDYVESQCRALRQYALTGGSVFVIGDPEPWHGIVGRKGLTAIERDLGTQYQLDTRPVALTDEVRRTLRNTAIRTNAGPNVLIKPERLAGTSEWRLHVVNRNYRWLEDKVDELKDVHITLDATAFGFAQVRDVQALSPDGAGFGEIHMETSGDGPRFTLPRLSIYTVVTFRSLE